jgi:hypothetical protein
MTRIFPPLVVKAEGWHKDGRGSVEVKHFWGSMRVPAQHYEHKTGGHCQIALDLSLDSSGWTAGALKVMMRLSSSLSYEKAEEVARDFRMLPGMSRAGLERLTQPYASTYQAATREMLDISQDAPLTNEGQGRKMVVEVDGVRVLGQPHESVCEGIEIKSVVIHPVSDPGKRSLLADVCEASKFTGQVAGLMREAGLRQKDEIIGLSDGAQWIKNLFESLGLEQIIDVYHSSSYLDTVMEALDWKEDQPSQTRRSWLTGDIVAATWLHEHSPDPSIWLRWDEKSQTALRYLEERQTHMNYPSYKARGFPIGSGQVEGMNKSVIGYRMKQSGMQWSRSGAGRMAALRAWRCSKVPLVSHDTIRHAAFPCPLG